MADLSRCACPWEQIEPSPRYEMEANKLGCRDMNFDPDSVTLQLGVCS